MGIAVSLLLTAAGLILALAVHPAHPGSVDPNTVGWIIFVVGLVALVLDLLLWSSYGPGYMRRRTTAAYVQPGAAPAAYPAQPVAPAAAPAQRVVRRTVVEENVPPAAPPGGPPPGY